MFARTIQRQSKQSVRTFASTAKAFSGHPEGAYNNLPFKVKNRRIPYAIPHIIFWALGCGIPVFAVCVQQKRAGLI